MDTTEKKTKYEEILSLVRNYREGSQKVNKLTLFSHVVNLLKNSFPYMDWVGFYLDEFKDDVLYLGPYVGQPGCDLIPFDKGVCGKAAREKAAQVVDDVSKICYHIACASSTKSEIVVPLFTEKTGLIGVLDVDSDALKSFDKTDQQYLKVLCYLLAKAD
jgi:L-methionine (R)-S-oxide reductase